MDDEYNELDFSDQDGPSLFDAPTDSLVDSPEPEETVVPPTKPAVNAKPAVNEHSAMAPVVEAKPSPHPEVPEPPLALYRRYRPDTFSEVIGQEHVTEPLKRALENNRVNHAYLFSGPRGCGKTTSARILARALNCEKGPTPEPCGECRSCRDLARGGPGSIDVIEIDAASHGGVDDARDLRERAFFAPVQSRYKIYIVDEAHMVTTAGFNALLKLVEEPPPHVKFIFATTEPEKVIGTIRSRTHHYPFRLVPPRVLSDYLRRLCDAEGVAIEGSVLPLVVRAGAGSVRDSLSVLDQLLGGAGPQGVTYTQSVALLGFTPDALLDEIVDAFAASDGAGVFATIDKVIEVGQDPRRFAEDLLRRLRDLVIVASVPDAASSGLIDVAADQAERLSCQVAGIGGGELTRAAEVIADGLVAMRGTTAPRLHLELMCARVLLPGADVDGRGIHARLDRVERRLGMPEGARTHEVAHSAIQAHGDDSWGISEPAVAVPTAAAVRPVPAKPEAPQEDEWMPPADRDEATPAPQAKPRLRVVRDEPEPTPEPNKASPSTASAPERISSAPRPQSVAPEREAAIKADHTPVAGSSGNVGPATADVRRLWPEVLEEVKRRRRFTWMTVSQHAQVTEVSGGALVLTFANPGALDSFLRGGSDTVLREALVQVMGADLVVSALLDSDGHGGSSSATHATAPVETAPVETVSTGSDSPDSPDEDDAADVVATKDESRVDPDPVSSASRADLLARARAQAAAPASQAADSGERDDPDVTDTDAESLLKEMLHAEVIDDE